MRALGGGLTAVSDPPNHDPRARIGRLPFGVAWPAKGRTRGYETWGDELGESRDQAYAITHRQCRTRPHGEPQRTSGCQIGCIACAVRRSSERADRLTPAHRKGARRSGVNILVLTRFGITLCLTEGEVCPA